MSQETSKTDAAEAKGGLLFFSRPELLTTQDHGDLGINPSAQSFDFVKSVRGVPITVAEMPNVQRDYPIVFSSGDKPSLVAAVGIIEDQNLFVGDDGQWAPDTYIPAYLRCYPFTVIPHSEGQLAVAIDRASTAISQNAEQPFFEGGELAPEISKRVDMCLTLDAQVRETFAFCARLAELDLLIGQEVTLTAREGDEKHTLGGYYAVDFRKLRELDAESLHVLHRDGALAAIYAHRFSLDRWPRLLDRRNRLHGDGNPA